MSDITNVASRLARLEQMLITNLLTSLPFRVYELTSDVPDPATVDVGTTVYVQEKLRMYQSTGTEWSPIFNAANGGAPGPVLSSPSSATPWDLGTLKVSIGGTGRPSLESGEFLLGNGTDGILSQPGIAASDLNQDAWTDYSSSLTFTGITIGNGTKRAHYTRDVNRKITFTYKFTFGTTSDVTGPITVALPVTAARANDAHPISAYAYNAATGKVVPLVAFMSSTTVITLAAMDVSGTYPVHVDTSATVPFDWNGTVDCNLSGGITYEAAS